MIDEVQLNNQVPKRRNIFQTKGKAARNVNMEVCEPNN